MVSEIWPALFKCLPLWRLRRKFRKFYLSDRYFRGRPNFWRFTKWRLARHVDRVEARVRFIGVPPVAHGHNFCVANDVHTILGNVMRVAVTLLWIG